MISKEGQGQDNANGQVDAAEEDLAKELSFLLLLSVFASILHLHISSQRHAHHTTNGWPSFGYYLASMLSKNLPHTCQC
jgi:hypothetical protein